MTTEQLKTLSPAKYALLIKTLQRQKIIGNNDVTIPKRPANTSPPLSFAQQRLWFLNQLDSGSPAYNMPVAVRLTGLLNTSTLEQSIQQTIRRHESLRTCFPTKEGQPVQHIHPVLRITIPIIDLVDLKNGQDVFLHRIAVSEATRSFELDHVPLIRVTLLKLDANHHVLLVTMHHIISDEWSMGVFVKEAVASYEAALAGEPYKTPPLSIQYADYAYWQRTRLQGENIAKLSSYWKQKLSGELAVLQLPFDHSRPAFQSGLGGRHQFRISQTTTQKLRSFSRQRGTTLFITLLTMFKVFLYKYTSQEDLLVGTPITIRNRVELEPLVGLFVNTLVLRTDFSGNPTFDSALSRVHETVNGAFSNQEMPFESLVEELDPNRDLSRNPVFQVMFSLQNVPLPDVRIADLAINRIDYDRGATLFDLTLDFIEQQDELIGIWEYDTDLFDATTLTRMSHHFQRLTEHLINAPLSLVASVPLMTEPEYHQIVEEWNDETVKFPADIAIHELFENQVERTPDRVAVIHEETALSFNILNQRANQLARHLRKIGVSAESPVGVYIERSPDAVIGLLAVLKAGGAYVALDPCYPSGRLDSTLEDCLPTVIVTRSGLRSDLTSSTAQIVCIDAGLLAIRQNSTDNLHTSLSPDNLAYVVYTSGSTGAPKGALIRHNGLVNAWAAWEKTYSLREHEGCYLQMASFSFDVFSGDLVRALWSGLTVFICPKECLLDPGSLETVIRQHHVTCGEFVPAVIRLLAQYIERTGRRLDHLWTPIVGSDLWYWDEYEALCRICPSEAKVVNSYGLSEVTIDSTYYTGDMLTGTCELVPIGRPFPNSKIYLLDTLLRPVPIGVPGELYIGGPGIARGINNSPSLTADRVIPNPFTKRRGDRLYKTGDRCRYLPNGLIEMMGRTDHQVKIRGYRIELQEIEATLYKHPEVCEVVVNVWERSIDDKSLVAYIVPKSSRISLEALKDDLRREIPAYMVPDTIILLEAMPLNSNGKIDRRNLPTPDIQDENRQVVLPRNDEERTICDVWQQVLKLESVSVSDDFFALGGHSLLIPQVIMKLQDAFEVDIPVRTFFDASTVAELARTVQHARVNDGFSFTDQVCDLRSEAILDSDIRACVKSAVRPSDYKTVLLTGATGFVGAFTLIELLKRTRADVYCLVRASDENEGYERIKLNLQSYDHWDVEYASRILPIIGDLGQPLVGLSDQTFKEMARQIDAIYSCGAWVNFTYPYRILKPVNVTGVRELLRLASTNRLKPIHHVSSLSVFAPMTAVGPWDISESSRPEHEVELLNWGYDQSKWVGEYLVRQAIDRGIPASLYRCGLIGGDSQEGINNTNDLLWCMIKGCIQLGSAPNDISVTVDVAPVDYVSQGLVQLSLCQQASGQTYHFFNPASATYNTVFDWIEEYGYTLKRQTYESWKGSLLQAVSEDSDNALLPFISLFKESGMDPFANSTNSIGSGIKAWLTSKLRWMWLVFRYIMKTIPQPFPSRWLLCIPRRYECRKTQNELSTHGINCPPLDKTLFHTYLSSLVRTKYLEAPDQSQ